MYCTSISLHLGSADSSIGNIDEDLLTSGRKHIQNCLGSSLLGTNDVWDLKFTFFVTFFGTQTW